jgi:hypothetical protein
VWVGLEQSEYDEYPDGEWRCATGVGVATSLGTAEIDVLPAVLHPDPAAQPADIPAGAVGPITPGHRCIGVWWD